MKRTRIYALALLALLGCDDERVEQATSAVKGGLSRLSTEYDEAKVLAHARAFIEAVEAQDQATLERLCNEVGNADYRAVMGCYYNAFAIENDQGTAAARKYVADELAKPDNQPAKAKALAALSEYMAAKGSLRTKEAAALVLVIGLESQYPHGGGMIGALIADKLGLMNPSVFE